GGGLEGGVAVGVRGGVGVWECVVEGRTCQRGSDVDGGAGGGSPHLPAGQRLVAGVGDHQVVVDGLAGVVEDAVARRIDPDHLLVEHKRRVLDRKSVVEGGGRGGVGGVRRRRVVDLAGKDIVGPKRGVDVDVLLGGGVVGVAGGVRSF